MGELGSNHLMQYMEGNRDVIAVVRAEEANLLHARRLARTHAWWGRVISTMQGLRALYEHSGYQSEWAALVSEIVPDFVDPTTDGPLPGREEQWGLVAEYRVRLAMDALRWAEAERLQRLRVECERKHASAALAVALDALDKAARNPIRTLAASLEQLGTIQREQANSDCLGAYREAIDLCQRIGDRAGEAVVALNLGRAYEDISALRDVDQAEQWYRRSLELLRKRDRLGRAKCFNQLGLVALERFRKARAARGEQEELLRHIKAAAQLCHQALDLLPADAVDDLAMTHNQLGNIYNSAGDLDRALPHYSESIRYWEVVGNLYNAARTRFNVAATLADAGRLSDALAYAQAALRNFETYGDRAADDIQKTQRLIAMIRQGPSEQKGGDSSP